TASSGSTSIASALPRKDASSCVISPCASTPISTPRRNQVASPEPSSPAEAERAMTRPVFPRSDASTSADDGDALRFCSTCAFSQACLEHGMDKSQLSELHVLVEHVGPFAAGEHIFRKGEPFDAIAAVRAGSVKTYVVDRDGHERV